MGPAAIADAVSCVAGATISIFLDTPRSEARLGFILPSFVLGSITSGKICVGISTISKISKHNLLA
ncbi:MAG: hypothetical protein QW272_09360 [Candidatus Methanomethylicaceae archaeon]